MPVGIAIASATEGAAFGIFPITWIVLTAIFLFELTVASGHHDDLMSTFNGISPDTRVLGVLLAFCFCAVLEALAGFGAPVAIVGVMPGGDWLPPLKAAVTVLVGNTFAVPFGAIATPIITGGRLTNIDYGEIGATVASQTSALVWVVPLLLLFIMDGWRGLREVWPFALVVGVSYAVISTWLSASFISVELTNMIAGLGSLAIGVMLRFWRPGGSAGADAEAAITTSRVAWALFPYLLIILVFGVTQLVAPVKRWLSGTDLVTGGRGCGRVSRSWS